MTPDRPGVELSVCESCNTSCPGCRWGRASSRRVPAATSPSPTTRRSARAPARARATGTPGWHRSRNGGEGGVALIDAQTYQVKRYLLVGQRVWNLAFNADESRLITTNGVSNDISVIDVTKQRVLKSVAVGEQPWGVVVRP